MLRFRDLRLALNDGRNWPLIFTAGALVFIGSQIFEVLGFDSAVWIIALIFMISFAARPFIKTWRQD